MSRIEDVLATLDEEDAEAIRQELAEKDALAKEKKRAERDLKLVSDDALKERFPRAWRAYQKKRLDLGDALEPDEVIAALKAKEEELAELGVPASDAPPPTQIQTPGAEGDGGEGAVDPAEAWGTPVAGGQPSGARNLTQEFLESMKAESSTDRAKMAEVVGLMNDGKREEIERLVDTLNAPPIVGHRGIW